MTNEVRELFDFISTNGESVLWDYGYGGSKAASSTTVEALPEARVTELVNGVLVSKPSRKVADITETKSNESEPVVIDLQGYGKSKAASSVQRVNEVREIFEFLNGKF